MLTREQMAARAARELGEGDAVYVDETLASSFASLLPAGAKLAGEGDTVDVAVVSANEVAQNGDYGGTSARGAKKVIALLEPHRAADGPPRVRSECTAPAGKSTLVITDLAVFDVTEQGLVLREVAPGVSALDVQLASEPPLLASDDLKLIES